MLIVKGIFRVYCMLFSCFRKCYVETGIPEKFKLPKVLKTINCQSTKQVSPNRCTYFDGQRRREPSTSCLAISIDGIDIHAIN